MSAERKNFRKIRNFVTYSSHCMARPNGFIRFLLGWIVAQEQVTRFLLIDGWSKEVGKRDDLTTCSEAAAVCPSHAKIFVRIDGSVVDAHFVVEMWTSAASAQAYIAECVAPLDMLPCRHRKVGQVAVASRDSMPVIHDDCATIAAEEVSENDSAIGRRDYGLTI